jgi:Protein of unknown function (DUF3102)
MGKHTDHTATAVVGATRAAILTRESVIGKLSDEHLVVFLIEETAAVNRIMDSARREAGIHALNVGHALIEAKRRFGQHGEWIPWLRKHLKFDERMAQRHMALARKGSAIMKGIANTKSVSYLTIRGLEAMARPPKESNPPPAQSGPAHLILEKRPAPGVLNAQRDLALLLAALWEKLSIGDWEMMVQPELDHYTTIQTQRHERRQWLSAIEGDADN